MKSVSLKTVFVRSQQIKPIRQTYTQRTPLLLRLGRPRERLHRLSSSTKKKRADSESQVLDILKQSSDAFIGFREKRPRDENITWAESIGVRLKNITPKQMALIRARIEQLTFDVEFAPEMPLNDEEWFGGPRFTILLAACCRKFRRCYPKCKYPLVLLRVLRGT